MDTQRNSMMEELYFHRLFKHSDPPAKIRNVEASKADIVTFVSEVIESALKRKDIQGWISPLDTGAIHQNVAEKTHFDSDIVDAVLHNCALEESLRITNDYEFDAGKLFELPSNEAKEYLESFIGLIVDKTRPVNISFIHVLAFVCFLCGTAAKTSKPHWMNLIASCAVSVFQSYFPFEWIYYEFKHWAFAYNFRHKQIHRMISVPNGQSSNSV